MAIATATLTKLMILKIIVILVWVTQQLYVEKKENKRNTKFSGSTTDEEWYASKWASVWDEDRKSRNSRDGMAHAILFEKNDHVLIFCSHDPSDSLRRRHATPLHVAKKRRYPSKLIGAAKNCKSSSQNKSKMPVPVIPVKQCLIWIS